MPNTQLPTILRTLTLLFSLFFIMALAVAAREGVMERQATVRLEDQIPTELRQLTWSRGFADCYGTEDMRSSCPVLFTQTELGSAAAQAAIRVQESLNLESDATNSRILDEKAKFLYLFTTDVTGPTRRMRIMEYDTIPCRTHSCGLLP